MKTLQHWLQPPVFDNEQKTEQAYLLSVIVWVLIVVPLPYLLFMYFSSSDDIRRALIQVGFGELVNILLLGMIRYRYVQAASILQVSAFWFFFTATAVTGSGVQGEAYLLGYALVIAIAGMLLGGRGAAVFTALSLITGWWMAQGQMRGIINSDFASPPLVTWIVSLVLFPVGAVLQQLNSRALRKALARARASESRYGQIIENAEEIIYTFSAEGNFTFISPTWTRLLGHNLDEVIGRNFVEFVHPEDVSTGMAVIGQLVASGTTQKGIEYRVRHKAGHWRWHSSVVARLTGDPKRSNIFVGIAQDITDRKESEQHLKAERDLLQTAQEKLQTAFLQQSAILNNIPDMAWLKDLDSRYIAVNEQFARTAGKPLDEILGRTDREIWDAEFAELYRQDDLDVIRRGEQKRIEEYQADSTGRRYWVETTKTPITDEHGNVIGTTGIARDISDRKQLEFIEQQRRERLEKVMRLGKFVTEVQSINPTLHRIWHSIRNDLGFDRLGIYLVDLEENSMQGTFGTDQQGLMTEEHDQKIPLDNNAPEAIAFKSALREANGLYHTQNYESQIGTGTDNIMAGVQDFAAVSAWMGEKPVAVLCVDNVISGRPITEDQIEALRLFAGYAGLAIENARLKDALQQELELQIEAEQREMRRRETLEKIVQLGKQVTEVGTLRTTLERIWHGIHIDIGIDRLAIFLYDADKHSVRGTLGTDISGQIVEEWDYERVVDAASPTSFVRALQQPDGVYFTSSFTADFNIPEGHEMYGVKEFAAITAWGGKKPVAIITVDNLPSGRHITDEQIEALRLFSGYAGLAIENARLNDALQKELTLRIGSEELEVRRRIILEKVLQLGKRVARITNLRTTLENIWHGVHDDLEFDRLAIFLYNPQDNVMDDTFGTDARGQMVEFFGLSFPLSTDESDSTTFTQVLTKPEGVYFTHNYSEENHIPEGHEMYGVRDFVAVAVWAGDKPVAVICADNHLTQRSITNEQLEALRLFSGYAGLAIENARLNTALEEDLERRKTLIAELENKNAELERFTYTVSHDLKSPLVTISGFLGYLEIDARAGNTERVQHTIHRITSAAHKMQTLLNDLLELSRIGRIINPPEAVPFSDLVQSAMDRVHGRLDEINALVEIDRDLPIVHGDKVRLIEVIQNLVENAVKYSNPQARTLIEIGSRPTSADWHVFHVRDNGIGIAHEYHEKIFGLFNKLDARAEGTGIGLTLVKRIIEVHGGQIWVESTPGAGATFYFTLPVSTKQGTEH